MPKMNSEMPAFAPEMTEHERGLAVARAYHARNQAVVNARGYEDNGMMLWMQTPDWMRVKVAKVILEEIMPALALMRPGARVVE